MKTALFALLTFLGAAAGPALPARTNSQATSSLCPDAKAWTGRYENHSYGFSIVIPKNVKGFWNGPVCVDGPDGCTCMTDHGRIMPLSSEPYQADRHIEVYAGFTADPDSATVTGEMAADLRWIRKRSRRDSVTVRQRSNMNLAGLKGQRMVARYYDLNLKNWLIEDVIKLLRDDVEYSLYLRTPEQTYAHDRKVFETVLASFALTDEKYGEKYNWKTNPRLD